VIFVDVSHLWDYIQFVSRGEQRGEMTMEFANTVFNQLGGNKFCAMTGARDLCGDESMITFRIGRNPKGVAKVQIELDPSDTYTLRTWTAKWDLLGEAHDVYCDQIVEVFEEMTGLRTKL
jgi:hypothetical protein